MNIHLIFIIQINYAYINPRYLKQELSIRPERVTERYRNERERDRERERERERMKSGKFVIAPKTAFRTHFMFCWNDAVPDRRSVSISYL